MIKSYFWRRMNMDRSPDLESSSSLLLEFRLFDILRRPAAKEDDCGSSFFGVNALLRLISTLDDCDVPVCLSKHTNKINISNYSL